MGCCGWSSPSMSSDERVSSSFSCRFVRPGSGRERAAPNPARGMGREHRFLTVALALQLDVEPGLFDSE
jgi:hypothetical protein